MLDETTLIHAGSHPKEQGGYVNPPVYRGSTVLYDNVAEMKDLTARALRTQGKSYGRFGTPTSRAFEEAMTELESGYGAIATPSGLAAITTSILALVETGDHLLVSQSVYQPTRNFCETLRRLGVETEYYDPTMGAAIAEKIRPRTRLIYCESPGSNTFEIQDLPAITGAARARGVMSIVDNTWATPLFLKPLRLGADIVVHSATKYIGGHSDSLLGVIVCNEKTYGPVRTESIRLGQCVGNEDAYFGLRGLRTLATRLRQHESQALTLAHWLENQPEVGSVLHPALPRHAGHEVWKRDFTGSSGLFAFELRPGYSEKAIHEMIDNLKYFGLGHGWGGFESLLVPVNESFTRLRVHVGLENLEDLKQDLAAGLQHL